MINMHKEITVFLFRSFIGSDRSIGFVEAITLKASFPFLGCLCGRRHLYQQTPKHVKEKILATTVIYWNKKKKTNFNKKYALLKC